LTAEIAGAIDAGAGRELGSGYQASVQAYRTSAGDVVVKKPHRGGPLGWLWRSLLKREQAVYERLDGIAGIPRSFGLVGGEYLALELVAGPSLREHEQHLADREAFFAKLLTTVRAMHAAGVAHGDFKRKDNIIVGAGERPYLIDFGIAVRRSAEARHQRRRARRPLFPRRAEDAAQLAVLVLDRRRVIEPEEEQRERQAPPARAREREANNEQDIARIERVADEAVGSVGRELLVLHDEAARVQPHERAGEPYEQPDSGKRRDWLGRHGVKQDQHDGEPLPRALEISQLANDVGNSGQRRQVGGAVGHRAKAPQ